MRQTELPPTDFSIKLAKTYSCHTVQSFWSTLTRGAFVWIQFLASWHSVFSETWLKLLLPFLSNGHGVQIMKLWTVELQKLKTLGLVRHSLAHRNGKVWKTVLLYFEQLKT